MVYDSADNAYYENGNCFKTEAEAKVASKKVKDLLLGLHGESATDGNQLPKLTTDVFDREDCPEWAKYAAVNRNGTASWFNDKPIYDGNKSCLWLCKETPYCVAVETIPGVWDASDWQNSLIERPKKKPEWCKFGVVGWHKRAGYFTVCADDELSRRFSIQQIDDKSRGWLSYETLCTEVKQARLRPYNEDEMKALVGKV